ncbi:MAG: hypothetical protein QOG53_2191 [Frankiales bacterium]|jgi:hypothetical protein|nr:hypothetical protein [Frankiales bacterium]
MTAEAGVELVEYPLVHGSTATALAYYDTIADIAMTLAGASLGSMTAWLHARGSDR